MSTDAPYEKPIKPETINDNSEHEQRNTPSVLRAELQIPPSATNDDHANQKQKYRLEWWKFGVEILTLFALIGYTIIAYHQWDAMYKATDAAKKSADATAEAVKVANDTLKMTERPWIGPKGISIDSAGNLTRKIRNSGHTPAMRVRTGAQWRWVMTDALDWISDQAPLIEAASVACKASADIGVVFPAQDYDVTLLAKKEPALAEVIQRARRGEVQMYLITCIEYMDTFGDTHYTRYCNYFERGTEQFPFCTHGDHAD